MRPTMFSSNKPYKNCGEFTQAIQSLVESCRLATADVVAVVTKRNLQGALQRPNGRVKDTSESEDEENSSDSPSTFFQTRPN